MLCSESNAPVLGDSCVIATEAYLIYLKLAELKHYQVLI